MYSDCVAGLMKVVKRVRGLHSVLDYEPQSIHKAPMAYILLDSFKPTFYPGFTSNEYTVMVRVVIPWVDNEKAEQAAMPFVNSVPTEIRKDPYLDGWLASAGIGGLAQMSNMKDSMAVFVKIGGVLYRALDMFVYVLEKTSQ